MIYLNFGNSYPEFEKASKEFDLSPSRNLLEAAHLLYQGLRYLDKFNLKENKSF